MKRKSILLIAVMMAYFCLMACTCTPPWHSFGTALDQEAVSSIELVKYKNPNQNQFPSLIIMEFIYKEQPFSEKRCTVLETLDKEREQEFLEKLPDIMVHISYTTDSPRGYCLKITYEDGNFIIISLDDEKSGYIGKYASDGTVLSHIGESYARPNEFALLVNEYFDYQVPVSDQTSATEEE